MDLKAIKALLDKYDNGETTLEEERALKSFFGSGEAPPGLEDEAMKFRFYSEAIRETIEIADEKLLEEIANQPLIIPFEHKRFRIRTAGIAAGILLITGAAFFMNRGIFYTKKNRPPDASNPQIAYAETRKALQLVSDKLNIGNRNLSRISKLNEMEELITKKNTTK